MESTEGFLYKIENGNRTLPKSFHKNKLQLEERLKGKDGYYKTLEENVRF